MKKVLITLAVIILISVIYYTYTQGNNRYSSITTPDSQSQTTSEATTTPAALAVPLASPTPDITKLKQGGSSYKDPASAYTFLYPNDYQLDPAGADQYTRISKRGATQKGQTEIYDGLIMVFEVVDLQGKTLEEFVDHRLASFASSDIVKVSQPKKAITIGDYLGFSYATEGFGSATDIVFQKDPTSNIAIVATYSVMDPEEVGYQKEVEEVLYTVEILK